MDRYQTNRCPSGDEKYSQFLKIRSSDTFAKYLVPKRLLRYLVKNTLERPHIPLKEHTIAMEFYGKGVDWDSSQDAIVRVQISNLRKLLAHYYLSEGVMDPILIKIDKNPYAPVFTYRQLPAKFCRATLIGPSGVGPM